MKTCVVCLGIGEQFARGIDRLKKSVAKWSPQSEFLAWTTSVPDQSPTHESVPYAFKLHCVREALAHGFDCVMWLDSSVIVRDDLTSLWEKLAHEGLLFVTNYHSVGEYTHDGALDTLGVTRNQAFRVQSLQGGMWGVKRGDARAERFLDLLQALSTDGVTYQGDSTTTTTTTDCRVKGHRHDQSAMSIVAERLGFGRGRWLPYDQKYFQVDRVYVKRRPLRFVAIPKNASTSIRSALPATPLDSMRGQCIPDTVTFAIVRHPLDRLVAWFFYHQQKEPQWPSYRDCTFEEWVLERNCAHHYQLEAMCTQGITTPLTQWEYVCNTSGTVLVNHLLRFEHLVDDWFQMLQTENVRTVSPLPNHNASTHHAWQSYYATEEVLKRAVAIVQRDFDVFDYTKPQCIHDLSNGA